VRLNEWALATLGEYTAVSATSELADVVCEIIGYISSGGGSCCTLL
jgi:hypothetical protein